MGPTSAIGFSRGCWTFEGTPGGADGGWTLSLSRSAGLLQRASNPQRSG
jgi:hypothetical protein